MGALSGSWTGLISFMVRHNGGTWPCSLDLDQPGEVLRMYDQQVCGVAKDYSQNQINAVSLLARLELAGVRVGRSSGLPRATCGRPSTRVGRLAIPLRASACGAG
jgi:hypothetical protein